VDWHSEYGQIEMFRQMESMWGDREKVPNSRFEFTFTTKPQPDRGPIVDDEVSTVVVWARTEDEAIVKAKAKVSEHMRYYSIV
jgi:hypothetical protein